MKTLTYTPSRKGTLAVVGAAASLAMMRPESVLGYNTDWTYYCLDSSQGCPNGPACFTGSGPNNVYGCVYDHCAQDCLLDFNECVSACYTGYYNGCYATQYSNCHGNCYNECIGQTSCDADLSSAMAACANEQNQCEAAMQSGCAAAYTACVVTAEAAYNTCTAPCNSSCASSCESSVGSECAADANEWCNWNCSYTFGSGNCTNDCFDANAPGWACDNWYGYCCC